MGLVYRMGPSRGSRLTIFGSGGMREDDEPEPYRHHGVAESAGKHRSMPLAAQHGLQQGERDHREMEKVSQGDGTVVDAPEEVRSGRPVEKGETQVEGAGDLDQQDRERRSSAAKIDQYFLRQERQQGSKKKHENGADGHQQRRSHFSPTRDFSRATSADNRRSTAPGGAHPDRGLGRWSPSW